MKTLLSKIEGVRNKHLFMLHAISDMEESGCIYGPEMKAGRFLLMHDIIQELTEIVEALRRERSEGKLL